VTSNFDTERRRTNMRYSFVKIVQTCAEEKATRRDNIDTAYDRFTNKANIT